MTKTSKLPRFVSVLLLAILVLTACGTPAPEATTEAAAAPSVALVLPGSIADEGYNAAAYAGLVAIEEESGAKVAYSEMVPLAEYEETFRDYAAEGYDLIIGHGFQFGDTVEVVAPEYPNTHFLVTSGTVAGPNYASLLHQNHQASYVAGYICARMSETDSIGAIGGFAYPVLVQMLEGFRLGAEAANPDIDVAIAYLDSFDDIGLGKEAALAQISVGADCVFHVADAAGIGVIQACEQEGVWAVGFPYDQNDLAPDTVITSTVVDYTLMLTQAYEDIVQGTFRFNEVHKYGLETRAARLADYHGLVPDDIAAEAEHIKDKIISGELVVPLISEPTK